MLVIGGDSLIAGALAEKLSDEGDQVILTSRRRSNEISLFLDLENTKSFLQSNPLPVDVVVICAAVTKFEQCRSDPERAFAINVSGPVQIAKYYLAQNSRIVFISTNAIFNGENPFQQADGKPNAKNAYGKLKADAEKQLIALSPHVAIVRFSKIIDPDNNIFSEWMSTLKKGKIISAFCDQFISPLELNVCIKVLIEVINDTASGIYQFSAKGDLSYFDIISQIALRAGISTHFLMKESAIEKGLPPEDIFRFTSLDSSRVEKLLNLPSPHPTAFVNSLPYFRRSGKLDEIQKQIDDN